ncbi:MAG: histidine kinase [Roseburia sp.]|nr:histidine kinase [Anaeroplasma bactoclasticum]MCM1196245.1 histidine kinase [Roseburia sp.]MCM1557153.1 histidine kinase [Anaeroplasma bactoclasticum]
MKRLKTISIFIFSFFCLCLGFSLALIFSIYNHEIYHYPANTYGHIDFEGYDLNEERSFSINMTGQWEFYYNRFIITDEDEEKMDAYIKIPGKWTGLRVNGKALGKEGYASYKTTLLHLPKGTRLMPTYQSGGGDSAYRVYYNKTLVGCCGTASKDIKETKNGYRMEYEFFYEVPEDGVVEVVIEVGMNLHGGITQMPGVITDGYSGDFQNLLNFFPSFVLGLIFFSALIGACIYYSYRTLKDRFSIFAMMILLLIHYLFSIDMVNLLRNLNVRTNFYLFQSLSFISYVLLLRTLADYVFRMKAVEHLKLYHKIYSFIGIPIYILDLCLIGTNVQQISWIILFLCTLPYYIGLGIGVAHNRKTSSYFFILFSVILDMGIVEMMDISEMILYSSYGYEAIFCTILIFIVFFLYFQRIKDLNKGEVEHVLFKQEILREQIKPHFIFNSLNAIKNLYHKNMNAGDEAMIRFSKHLRTNVDALDHDMISFEDELVNIINYVELENVRLDKPFTLLLDIQYQEFLVPVLSLQPLVENAIKYSRVNEREDGYIQVKSYKKDDLIYIIVVDNGVGFDIKAISSFSKGISNLKERLFLMLNADVKIESKALEGTMVTITFSGESK